MTAQQAHQTAKEHLQLLTPGQHVYIIRTAIVVGENEAGYWVSDNGNESGAMSFAAAQDVIVAALFSGGIDL